METVHQVFSILHDQFEQFKNAKKNVKIVNETEEASSGISIAKPMLEKLMTSLSDLLVSLEDDEPSHIRLLAMQSVLCYEESKILIELGEELSAQEVLLKCLEIIEEHKLTPEIAFIQYKIISQVSHLLIKHYDLTKSQTILEEAENTYNTLMEQDLTPNYYNSMDLFSADTEMTTQENTRGKLEKLVTCSLQMLTYVYNKQGLHSKFLLYNHKVLRRQLEMLDGNPLTWVSRATKLATYFINNDRYSDGQHYLSAAGQVLVRFQKVMENEPASDDLNEKWEDVRSTFAEICKCWVTYCNGIFSLSKKQMATVSYNESKQFLDRLLIGNQNEEYVEDKPRQVIDDHLPPIPEEENGAMEMNEMQLSIMKGEMDDDDSSQEPASKEEEISAADLIPEGELAPQFNTGISSVSSTTDMASQTASEGSSEEAATKGSVCPLQPTTESKDNLRFPTLNQVDLEVTTTCIENNEQAAELFNFCYYWLHKAMLYHSMSNCPIEYIYSLISLCELYENIGFFEEDIDCQYEFQRKRADTLEKLIGLLCEVRPQGFIVTYVEALHELAKVQLDMLAWNMRRIYAAKDPELAASGSTEENSELTQHKIEALADIQAQLKQFATSAKSDTAIYTVDEQQSDEQLGEEQQRGDIQSEEEQSEDEEQSEEQESEEQESEEQEREEQQREEQQSEDHMSEKQRREEQQSKEQQSEEQESEEQQSEEQQREEQQREEPPSEDHGREKQRREEQQNEKQQSKEQESEEQESKEREQGATERGP